MLLEVNEKSFVKNMQKKVQSKYGKFVCVTETCFAVCRINMVSVEPLG